MHNKTLLASALLLTFIPLSLFIRLASFTRLIADDFCGFYFAERFGLLRSIWYWRLNWTGVYTAFAIDWFVARLAGSDGLKILLPVLMLVWLALGSLLIYKLLPSSEGRDERLLVSVLLSAAGFLLLLIISPDVPQSFLWWTGMRAYSMPLPVLIFLALIYLWLSKNMQTRGKKIAGGVASFGLVLLSAGMSQTFSMMLLALVLFLIALRFLPLKRGWLDAEMILLLSALAAILICLIIFITAPGNEIRQAQLPPSPGLGRIITISLQGIGYYLLQMLLSPLQMSALLAVLLLSFWAGEIFGTGETKPGLRIGAWAAAGFILFAACFPPAVYGYSEPPPPRTMSIAFYGLIMPLMVAAFMLGGTAKQKILGRRNVLAVAVILLVGVSFTQSISLYKQIEIYRSYAEYWDRTNAQILEAKNSGAQKVIIEPMENWAHTNLLNDNPKFWVNICYSQYYGIPVSAPPRNTGNPK